MICRLQSKQGGDQHRPPACLDLDEADRHRGALPQAEHLEAGASQAHGEKVEGRPAGPAAPDARSCAGAASLARPDPAGSLPVLRGDLQLSSLARVQGLRRQAMAEGARQAKPERPRELGVLQVDPDRLPTARPGPPSGVARMIHPPQVRLEEPIAVTPHDGICGGESQQWLSYPTNRTSGSVRGGDGKRSVATQGPSYRARARPRLYHRRRGLVLALGTDGNTAIRSIADD